MAKKLVLVTGGTGQQGRGLVRALASDPEFHVWVLTRTITSPAANELATTQQHVTVVQGNLDSPETIRKTFEDAKREHEGIWGVFCVLAFPGLGADAGGEEKQGKTLADISAEYGVTSFIFSSVERGGEYNDENAKLDRRAKVLIERHVRGLGESKGLKWTILRPGFFMENYNHTIGKFTVGVLKTGLKETTTTQLVAAEDIGNVAAAVFKSPQGYTSQILVIVGDELTTAQQQEAFTRATSKQLPSIPWWGARILIALNSHTQAVIADIERVHDARRSGKCPEVEEQMAMTRRAYPHMKTFEEWARQRGGNSSTQQKNWNQVSVGALVTGRQ
ncbi:NAD(P)-binding protein [Mycena alexandri]|uniref:NAD(P)-binding protein n=1 Tax=Mycena alexandri TaxID=1745969 RepID=A0AAD6WZR8_9AGAR|nr:NAD(P)-binding protein [Mycena alexandri]